MKQIIRDQIPFTAIRLEEGAQDATGQRPLVVSGVFQKADTLNANNRIYPRLLWEKILNDGGLKEALGRRRMFGEIDHPPDWRMNLRNTSHIITDLKMDESGNVYGKAEIIPTPMGKILESIFKSGCEVGISSRGTGSTSKTNEGHEVVGEDYQLETFDFVAAPSTPGAYPQIVQEAIREARYNYEETKMTQPLERFRLAEREGLDLIDINASGKAKGLLQERIEDKLAEILKLTNEDRTVGALAGPVIAALTQKRAELTRREVPMKKTKIRETGLAKASGDTSDAAKTAGGGAVENSTLDKVVAKEVPSDTSSTIDNFEDVDKAVKGYMEDGEIEIHLNPNGNSSDSSSDSGSGSGSMPSTDDSGSGQDEDSDSDSSTGSSSKSKSSSGSDSSSFDPDKVFASEAEIKQFAKGLAKSPVQLEAFLRNAVKRHNAQVDARRRAERVAEAIIRRHKQGRITESAAAAPVTLVARYRFVCEAMAELKRRYQGLRRRFIVAEALASLPRKDKMEWVKTLSRAKTIREMLAGIEKVKKLSGITEEGDDSTSVASPEGAAAVEEPKMGFDEDGSDPTVAQPGPTDSETGTFDEKDAPMAGTQDNAAADTEPTMESYRKDFSEARSPVIPGESLMESKVRARVDKNVIAGAELFVRLQSAGLSN